jgi:hypothetical protein
MFESDMSSWPIGQSHRSNGKYRYYYAPGTQRCFYRHSLGLMRCSRSTNLPSNDICTYTKGSLSCKLHGAGPGVRRDSAHRCIRLVSMANSGKVSHQWRSFDPYVPKCEGDSVSRIVGDREMNRPDVCRGRTRLRCSRVLILYELKKIPKC